MCTKILSYLQKARWWCFYVAFQNTMKNDFRIIFHSLLISVVISVTSVFIAMKKLILVIIIFVGKISSFEQTVTDKNAEGSWNMQDVSPFCTFWTGVGE